MADYFAVLQRTLAGFEAPQEQLRQKLYERARLTIKRQLDGRTPTPDEETIDAEMAKLDQAIHDIEAQYGGDAPVGDVPVMAEPEPVQPDEPVDQVVDEPEDESAVEPVDEQESDVSPEAVEPPVEEPFSEEAPVSNFIEEHEETPKVPVEDVHEAVSEFAPETQETVVPHFAPEDMEAAASVEQSESVETVQSGFDQAEVDTPSADEDIFDDAASAAVSPTAQDPIAMALADFTKADEERKAERLEDDAGVDASNSDDDATPIDSAANDAVEAALTGLPQAAALDDASLTMETETTALRETDVKVEKPSANYSDPAADLTAPHPVPELQPVAFNETPDDGLAIPPAPGVAGGEPRDRKKSRWVLWLLLLLILLGGIGTAYVMFKDTVMQTLGLAQQSVTATPTKVKTIKVTPPPAEPETEDAPASVVTPEVQSEPKSEVRLTANGEEQTPQDTVEATQDGLASNETPAAPATSEPATAAGTRAFLYEEDAASGTSSVNNGNVTWSIVQESPGPGKPDEPAIRAQIEIPDRKAVIIMTLKRNTDPGLTASHIIDVIFAVPDDFSGGAIEQINRIVLKETEEDRGETLTAGSVKIQSGIFLVALDNLEAARDRNVELLKSRAWVDIPVQYRTGRRALVTIEKGSDGERAFEEAFSAWEKAS